VRFSCEKKVEGSLPLAHTCQLPNNAQKCSTDYDCRAGTNNIVLKGMGCPMLIDPFFCKCDGWPEDMNAAFSPEQCQDGEAGSCMHAPIYCPPAGGVACTRAGCPLAPGGAGGGVLGRGEGCTGLLPVLCLLPLCLGMCTHTHTN